MRLVAPSLRLEGCAEHALGLRYPPVRRPERRTTDHKGLTQQPFRTQRVAELEANDTKGMQAWPVTSAEGRSVSTAPNNEEDGTFKGADELQALYQSAGITGDRPIITYCRIGERSSHSWFVLKYLLGHENTRNYDGSWTEWGNLVAAPVATGAGTAPAVVRGP